MEVTALKRNVRAADLPLEKLAASTAVSDRDKIAEVSRQFEAILLRQILSEAQKPVFKSALVEADNSTNSIYQGMVVQQMAEGISRGGTFGFARELEHQLAAQYLKKDHSAEGSSAGGPAPVASLTATGLKARDFAVPPDSASRTIPASHPPDSQKREPHRFRKNEPQPGKRI